MSRTVSKSSMTASQVPDGVGLGIDLISESREFLSPPHQPYLAGK